MVNCFRILAPLLVCAAAYGQEARLTPGVNQEHPTLATGSPAPAFSLPGIDGKIHKLSEYNDPAKRFGPHESTEGAYFYFDLEIPGMDISVGNRKFRYTEERIYEDDPIYAIGKFLATIPATAANDNKAEEDFPYNPGRSKWHRPKGNSNLSTQEVAAFSSHSWLGEERYDTLAQRSTRHREASSKG